MATPRQKLRVKVWKEAGYEFVMVPYDLGMMHSGYGWVTPPLYNRAFWNGSGDYMCEDVETVLWRVLAVYPNAKIVLWPWIDVYPGWAETYPRELMRNEEGKGVIVSTHFLRTGSDPDSQKTERYAWSVYSPVFREQGAETLRKFIETVKGTVPGQRVVGYFIGGGQDAQLYTWDPPNYTLQQDPSSCGDYSEPAILAWRQWLKKRYQTPQKLSEAWGVPIQNFEEAKPPKAASLLGPEPLFNPATEQRSIDWRRFLAEGRVELVSWFAKVIRDAAGPDVLVGASAGDGGARFGLSASAVLLQDPNLDMIWHQATYGQRLPPNTGGINAMLASHALHKKAFVADMDQRTWVGETIKGEKKIGKISFSDQSVGRAADIGQLRSMWRREMAMLWANGAGADFHPLGGPQSYEDEGIRQELKYLREKSVEMPVPAPTAQAGDIAVIYDERSISYLKGALSKLHNQWANAMQAQLNASGVPYRLYYADDLRNGLIPPAKIYLFINQLLFDEPLVREVEKLKRNGNTLVWLQGAGYAQASTQPDLVSKTIGMKIKPYDGAEFKGKRRSLEGFSATAIRTQSLTTEGIVGWSVDDENALPLAFYPEEKGVGLAYRDHVAWRTFFVGGIILSPKFINALAEFCGAWRMAPAGNVVSAGTGWVSIHPLKDGEVELRLAKPATLKSWWPETLSSSQAQVHSLDLKAGTTYIFDVK